MKFFKENTLGYKVIIAIVIVVLFNFAAPTISSAATFGGILFEPIKDLLLVIADGIMSLLQSFLFGMDVSFMTINYEHDNIASIVGTIAGLVGAAAMIVIGVAGAPFSGGLSLAAVAAGIKIAVGTIVVSVGAGLVASYIVSNALPQKMKLPMFAISPEEIFKNKIALLDVNFFQPNKYEEITTPTGTTGEQTSSALILRPTITSWYYALRNFAIVALLLILVYTAIRIIISSSADDKAKYKQRLIDWLVAMCLLFFMHYIMAFAVTLTEEITKAVNVMNDDYGVIIGSKEGDSAEEGKKLSEYVYEDGTGIFDDSETANALRKAGVIVKDTGNANNEFLVWPSDMMGKARIELQLEPKNITEDEVLMRQFGYTVIYLALVMYTILFLFRYLKRLMMLAFLTIIAPLMAMTYPLDKMRDGSAQGFNMWLKEYLFNLLIQPVHLILYTILIGSAMDLVVDNLLYGLVALGFILQAEKLLRKFFGFDKASTVEGGSALGGALAMQGLNMVNKALGRDGKSGKGKGKGESGAGKTKNNKLERGHDKGKDAESLIGAHGGQALEDNNEDQMQIPGFFDNDGGAPGTDPANPNNTPQDTRRFAPTNPNNTPQDTRGLSRYWLDETRTGRATKTAGQTIGNVGKKIESGVKTGVDKIKRSPATLGNALVNKMPISEGAKNAWRNSGRTLAKHAKQLGKGVKYVAPRAAKFAAKTAVKGTLAGAGAMVGLTSALVSDDFSNVGKYTLAGLGGGWAAGSGVAGLPETLNNRGDGVIRAAEDMYDATHIPSEVKARQNAKADAQWRADKEKVAKYAEKLGVSKSEAKKIMKEDAQRYREYGITDDSIIIDSMKANEFGGADRVTEEKLLLALMSSQVSKVDDVSKQGDRLVKDNGFSKDMAKKYEREIKKQHNWS